MLNSVSQRPSLAAILLGILLGLITEIVVIGGGSFLYFQQLSSNPPRPTFPDVKKESTELDLSRTDNTTYVALVTYQGELLMRDKPSTDSKVVDKLHFDNTVLIEGDSSDRHWQQVRFEYKGTEGWIRAGNIKRAQ